MATFSTSSHDKPLAIPANEDYDNNHAFNIQDDQQQQPSDESQETRYVPKICTRWWLKPITCFFTAPGNKQSIPALLHEQWMILWACCLVSFLGMYDWEVFPTALSMIQLDLNITEAQVGYVGSAVRLGNALSFPMAGSADWIGRKNTMFACTIGFIILSIGTAFTTEMVTFTALQVLGRGFMAAQTTLSSTMVVESLDNNNRGWGIGFMNAISVIGGAVALIAYGIFGSSSAGWRWMYGLSVVLLLPVALLYRHVPESTKFVQYQIKTGEINDGDDMSPPPAPLDLNQMSQLKCKYIKRLIVCGIVSFCNGFAFAPSETFKIKKLVEFHAISPPLLSFIQISTGFVSFASFTVSGSLSDRYGRKLFLVLFNTLCAIGVVVFFVAPANGPIVYLANFVQMLAGFVLMAVKSAYFAELFPTSQRARAQSFLIVIEFLSGGIALALESVLYANLGDHWTSCALLSLPGLLSGPLMGMFLPDTSSKDLDDVAPELSGGVIAMTSLHIITTTTDNDEEICEAESP